MFQTHIKVVDGLSHIEPVYGVNDDGGSCQESEDDEK